MPTVFQQYCTNALSTLNSQFRATQVLPHNVTAGSVREQIIRDFLIDHLPELISVVSGCIFDTNDNYSRQQDIVLVLKSTPRLPFASAQDLIFQEGVVATLEVKTTVSAHVIKSVGENIESVRRLVSRIAATTTMAVTHAWPSTRILTVIVTYGGASKEVLVQTLDFLAEEAKPDLMLDLSKGLLIRNHGLLIPKGSTESYIWIDDPAAGFKMFLTFLTEITGTLSSRGVTWRHYW